MVKSNRKLFIKNTMFNMGLKLVNQVIAIFILPLFVKNLGAELYGIWILSFVILGYFNFIELGFGEGLTKYISNAYFTKDKEKFNYVLNTGIFIYFLIGVVICLICYFFHLPILRIFRIQPENLVQAKHMLLIAGFFSLIQWPMRIVDIVFKGTLKFKPLSLLSAPKALITNIVLIISINKSCNIETLFIIRCICDFILWIPLFITMMIYYPTISFKMKLISFKIIKEIFPFSFGVFISRIISFIGLQLDNFLIGVFLSMGAITSYTVASKLFYSAYMQVGMLSGVIWPTIFSANAINNKNLINKMLVKGTKYMAIIASPIGYLGIIISYSFIKLWVGLEFVKYVIWSQVFMSLFLLGPGLGIAANIAMASGKCRQFNTFSAISVLINVVVSVLLIRIYGIGGPIIGTFVSNLVTGPITFPYFCKLINADWKKPMLTVYKIVFINLPSFFLFYWLTQKIVIDNWFIIIFIASFILVCFYLPLYFLFFDVEEKNDIKNIFKKIFSSRPKQLNVID